MPEGDALPRTARKMQVLIGEKLTVETPHPRARLTGVAERLDGRKLVKVEAVGKNLLLRFEDGLVLRSHLRMKGRWQVQSKNGTCTRRGMPWLVLRGAQTEAVLWHGPVLELDEAHVRSLGPDILADPPEIDVMVSKFRTADRDGDRRGPPRPAARRGNRQPLAGRSALAGSDLAVADARRRLGRGVAHGSRRSGAADAPLARLRAPSAGRVPASRPALPAVQRTDQVARPR